MTVVITGASDGIGLATARQLKNLGYDVVIVGRNKEKTERVAKELNVKYHLVDYTRLSDVERLADELGRYEIDVLCNNIGGMFQDLSMTEDQVEKTFQVNVLGAFYLTNLLMDNLKRNHAKVIQTSSIATNLFSDFDINDLQSIDHYSTMNAYGNAKICLTLLTREFHKRYPEIKAVAFEPGIVRSNFGSESNPFLKFAFHSPLKYLFTISTRQSAGRLVYLVREEFEGGQLYSGKKKYRMKYEDDGTRAKLVWEGCEKLISEYKKKKV